MMAVKASYDNGVIRWKTLPKITGQHPLTIVFEDVEILDTSAKGPVDNTIEWQDMALLNLERAYGESEPVYSDAMLQTHNPEFTH